MPENLDHPGSNGGLNPRLRPQSILWGMICLYGLILLLLGGLSSWRDYNASLSDAELNATNYVNLLEEHAKRTLEAADLIMLRLLDRVAAKGIDGVAASQEDWWSLEAAAMGSPQTGALYLIDAKGDLRFTTRSFPAPPATNYSGRDYFRAMMEKAPQPYVARSFFEDGSGRASFAIARRIETKDGSFAGVAVVTIESEYFREFYRNLGFSEHVAFGIYKHDGSILVRYPMVDADVGRTIPSNAPLQQLLPTKPIGTFRGVSTYDAFHRVVAYRKVDDPAITLWVATTEEDALEGWWLRLARNAGLGLISIIALAALSHFALRGIRREAEVTAKLAALFEFSPIGMVRSRLDGGFIEVNPAFLAMVGRPLDEVLTIGRTDLTPESYAESDRQTIKSLLINGRYGPYEKEYLHASGRPVPVSLNGVLVKGGSGEPYLWSTIEDISARKQAEEATQQAASVFHNTAEAIVITDPQARILSVNPAFTQITGYSADDAIGRSPAILKSDRHGPVFYKEMWASLLETGQWQGQIWNRRKDGQAYLAWQTISSVTDDKGQVVRFVSVSSDVTELHLKDEQIRHQAYHDALTGLPNRLLLQDRLGHAIEVARRERERVAVMFIDLDRFKVVNDSLGHKAGDTLLVEAAKRLQERLRKSDTIARLGGDEFVVVLSFFETLGEVAEVAESIIGRFQQPIPLLGHDMHVTASVGVALFPRDGSDVDTLMMNADTAMYRAKEAGRSTFRFFDPTMNAEAMERLNLEEALRRAIDNREFTLYYQPKVDLRTGGLAGVEALIRWISPDRGLISPNNFIPLAEETGLILPIGDWVLEEAFRQAAEWHNRGFPPIKVAINASAKQFLNLEFADKVSTLLANHGLDSDLIEIELTESAVMSEPEKAVAQLLLLRQLGIRVSVDDFGTGYSSLSYLKRLPLTTVKIDRSFVHGVDLEPDNAAIVGAILGLAESLGLTVVAEGIETEGEERYLKAAGCPIAQGFRYAKPLAVHDFEAWLDRFLAPVR
ncbi:PAS domain S-box/diguanylate cyclase (GGDEF) domain-containing protein (modular protein) [Candidatus Terasakiella magnetica]|nr:PAS domain S-box/diguanylate cyclase (GGDEF) domain-containing protein (modular protein) [Candidatus Terasakiella magnetica]